MGMRIIITFESEANEDERWTWEVLLWDWCQDIWEGFALGAEPTQAKALIASALASQSALEFTTT
jgi:hypothetical protein